MGRECVIETQPLLGSLLSSTTQGGHSLNSPLHCQAIFLWQFAPGLLKSQAAQVASSTMAEGCEGTGREQLGFGQKSLILM